ncbi:hypothetical protein DKX38_028578 [Salix brachista]|uniref:Uncharacterized protein n=1 Tax=Salix brachista TaxID=2182728 RepID=A0A5N5J6Y7_9ROSI|nr:hypothetical protein DKX38_028578 [Salix brachista]
MLILGEFDDVNLGEFVLSVWLKKNLLGASSVSIVGAEIFFERMVGFLISCSWQSFYSSGYKLNFHHIIVY